MRWNINNYQGAGQAEPVVYAVKGEVNPTLDDTAVQVNGSRDTVQNGASVPPLSLQGNHTSMPGRVAGTTGKASLVMLTSSVRHVGFMACNPGPILIFLPPILSTAPGNGYNNRCRGNDMWRGHANICRISSVGRAPAL